MDELNDWFDAAFAVAPVMAILRGFSPAETVRLAQRAWDIGVECVEVPIQTADAVPSLRALIDAGRERGRAVGAGTVIHADQVRLVQSLGGAFTVAPGLDEDIVRLSADVGIPHLPGVATASEMQRAYALGLRWLKAFPATVLGTGWFRAMAGPFPGAALVATGGIAADNAAEYLAAGARVVAVGSALGDPEQLDALAGLIRQASAGAAAR